MLGVNKYKPKYVEQCRKSLKSQVSAYKKFVKSSGASNKATAAFEPVFFNNLLIAMDNHFTHRLRGVEGKDGNPLNEVRMLTGSLVENGGTLAANSTIRYDAEESVLGFKIGDKIQVGEKDFARISKAFFAEIEARYS